MNHLNDDQLSARLDGALNASDDAAAGRHLDDCSECRARLAALSELDASLRGALTHDPGEAYFASFADRVGERIAAAAPAASPLPGGGLFGWWRSPRGLTLAGSAAALLAVAAIAVVLSRDQGADRFASQLAPESEVGSPAPAEGAATSEAAAQPTARTAPPAPPAPAVTISPRTSPARAREMRTLDNGEQVPVPARQRPAMRQNEAAPAPAPAQISPESRGAKPQSVSPMASTPANPAREPEETAAGAADARPAQERVTSIRPPAAVPPLNSLSPPPTPAPAAEPARKSRFDVKDVLERAKSTSSTSTSESAPQSFAPPPSVSGKLPARGEATSRFLSTPYQAAVDAASQAERAANADRDPSAYDRAAAAWTQAATLTRNEQQVLQARRAAAMARLQAFRLAETAARRIDAVTALDAWIAAAPQGPRRDEARRTKAESGL